MPQCMFCGKVTATGEGVKRHIVGRPECRRQWSLLIEEADAANSDPPDVDFSYENMAAPGHVHQRGSSDTDQNPTPGKIRRVTVEEIDDEDATTLTYNGRYFEPQSDAGWALREGETTFERYKREQKEEGEDQWAPFENA